MAEQLSNHASLWKLKAATASGVGDVLSDPLDCSAGEGVSFLFTQTVFDAGNSAIVEQSKDDVTYTAVSAGINIDSAGDVLFVDVYKPRQSLGRYVRVRVDRQVATAVGEVFGIVYRGRRMPIGQPDGTKAVQLVSPEAV